MPRTTPGGSGTAGGMPMTDVAHTSTRSGDAASSVASWPRATAAQARGDYLTAAALYLDCPPDPVRGAAPALFSAGWCLELARETEKAGDCYARAVAQSREPSLTVEALFRMAWIEIEAGAMAAAGTHLARLGEVAMTHDVRSATVEHAEFWHVVCVEHDGRLVDAAARYAAIIERGHPELWPEAAYRRLSCLSQVGDLSAALQAADALRRATRAAKDPARLRALQDLAADEAAQIARALAAA